jgi:hypothetical protein
VLGFMEQPALCGVLIDEIERSSGFCCVSGRVARVCFETRLTRRTFDEPYASMASNARPLGQVLGPPLPSTSIALPQSTQAHVSPPNLDLPILQGASRVLQDYFAKDSQIMPDIGELLVFRRSVQWYAQ